MARGDEVEGFALEILRLRLRMTKGMAQNDKRAARSDGAERYALEILRLRLRMKKGGSDGQEGVVEGQAYV